MPTGTSPFTLTPLPPLTVTIFAAELRQTVIIKSRHSVSKHRRRQHMDVR